MNNLVLECLSLAKQYADGANSVQVLNDLNFELNAGELVAILGVSGSGKSTLLNVLGGSTNLPLETSGLKASRGHV